MFKRIDRSKLHAIYTYDNCDQIMIFAKFNSQVGTGTHFGPAGISSELFTYQKNNNYILNYFEYVTGYNLEPGIRRFMPSSDYFDFLFSRFYYKYGVTKKLQKEHFELEKLKIIDHIGMPCIYYETQSFQEIVFLDDGYVLDVRLEDMRIATDFKMRCMKGAD